MLLNAEKHMVKLMTNFKRQDSLRGHRERKRSWSISVNYEGDSRPQVVATTGSGPSLHHCGGGLSKIFDRMMRSGHHHDASLKFSASEGHSENRTTLKISDFSPCTAMPSKNSCYKSSSSSEHSSRDESKVDLVKKDVIVLSVSRA